MIETIISPNTLIEKYPELFKNTHLSLTDQTEKPSHILRSYNFQCGQGWHGILCSLFAVIRSEITAHSANQKYAQEFRDRGESLPQWLTQYFDKNPVDPLDDFVIDEIKEKFGGLRVYYSCSVALPVVDGAISMAESVSFKICEECGNAGVLRAGGWLQTLCDTHAKDRKPLRDIRSAKG